MRRQVHLFNSVNNIFAEAIKCGASVGSSFLLCMGFLYFGKYSWWVYTQTPVGQQYLRLFGEKSTEISQFYSRDLLQLSFEINWLIIQLALLTAVACRILFLKSTFYDPKGNIEYLFFWSVPLALFAAWLLERALELDWDTCFIIVLIPTDMIFRGCMRLVGKILPDGILLVVLWNMSHRLFQSINCTLTKNCALL